ncbi:SRPBCC family protein [Martelella soudanensis]|uniref:hypothetical protein n=1 Tax=unclassified Martelella TaxID=2629616 RepID=UPI0015DFD267|nr:MULTISPECIES: hypothetical protein [unclassified Martelella]
MSDDPARASRISSIIISMIHDYSGKVQVIPITDGNRALVHWCGTFSIREGDPDEVKAWVQGIYQRDIEDMRAYFAGS